MNQSIATQPTNTNILTRISEFQTIAKLFAQSNLFTDAKGEAQCFVKILAGAELGIPPFTAMNSFHIIQGKPTMTAGTIAARVKASGRYDYQVLEKSSTRCSVQFFENGKPVHVETWTAERAQKAGVQNMGKFPDAMLFARAITAGARAVAPDIVGQFYTPEEMGAQVNAEGEVIQGESRQVEPVVADVVAEKVKELGGTLRAELPQDWKATVTTLGVKSGAFIKGADIGLAADISAAQSAARDLLNKNGSATKAEFDTVTADLQSVIDRAEAIKERDAIPA